jgi:spore maturation protein CgeB
MPEELRIVIFGLAVTSSWGNGHATTYRGLIRGLKGRGHDVTFFERNLPWYANNRDLPELVHGRVHLYSSLSELKRKYKKEVCEADLVIVGSYVPEGIQVGEWVTNTARGATAFYDIDTPVTISNLASGDVDYISPRLIPRYNLYLSFTGGPILRRIELIYGSPLVRPLYCSVDPELYFPELYNPAFDLGYMGTYSADRQPFLEQLMLEPARLWNSAKMIVAGPQYPRAIKWPSNVRRIMHVAPADHRKFYGLQKFTLNLTREAMRRAGYSPSVRLFEAAACGVPIISDSWEGIGTFLKPGEDILTTNSAKETLHYLCELSESERTSIGASGRARIMREHTALHRAAELESYAYEALRKKRAAPRRAVSHATLNMLRSGEPASD